MGDMFSKAKRSEIMSRVKGSDNVRTERHFIRLLRKSRITGWRRGYPVEGKPDIAFPSARVSVFLDGCFWHGCPFHWSRPATNSAFWVRKLDRNKKRDREVNRLLRSKGW